MSDSAVRGVRHLSKDPDTAETEPAARGSQPLVLVVDDEVNFARRLKMEFEEAGFRAEAVHRGDAALEHIRRAHPDLVILDVRMPGMDGLECLHKLRAGPESADTPVMLLTADTSPRVDAAALIHHGCIVVSKPVSYRTVIRIASRMLASM
jgi:CheY-like chemotaxis protein